VLRNSFIACAVLSALGSAQAGEGTSASYSACLDKAGGVTSAMQDCIKQELEVQDRSLTAAYQTLMGSLPEKRRAQLRDAQRKWIAFRDANCRFYLDPEGGVGSSPRVQ
jgi:uncharacterized protein YecT (DUF1311 family)